MATNDQVPERMGRGGPVLVIDGASRHYSGAGRPAVDRVSLTVEEGEFIALLGPSGCGKTTLLRMVAGFEPVDTGRIAIRGLTVSGAGGGGDAHVPPEDRRLGLVFQSYALWPHMTVAGNIAYPLETAGVPRASRTERVAAALATVGLTGFDARRPADLSGGQRQRVALARCLVMEPALVLLDEPLANLDVHLRAAMEEEFAAFHAKTGATMLYVTHDQAEAMALADRIAVLDGGRVAQIATPRTLYREPATPMVAGFVGAGVVVPVAILGADRDSARCSVFGYETTLRCRSVQATGQGFACLRPEEVRVDADGPIAATVARAAYKGGFVLAEVVPDAAPGVRLPLHLPPDARPCRGERLRLSILGGWVVPEADLRRRARIPTRAIV